MFRKEKGNMFSIKKNLPGALQKRVGEVDFERQRTFVK